VSVERLDQRFLQGLSEFFFQTKVEKPAFQEKSLTSRQRNPQQLPLIGQPDFAGRCINPEITVAYNYVSTCCGRLDLDCFDKANK
jgi:hypothetical protein